MKELKKDFGLLYYFETEVFSEEFKHWLCQYIHDEDFNKYQKLMLRNQISEFIVLKDLEIDLNYRGQGIGKQLLTEFLILNKGKKIILIAEQFGNNFLKLEDWYQSYGFNKIEQTIAGPLMLKID